MSTNQKEFLEELTALTHKYGIQIGGCGCCGSPAIYKTEPISREEATKTYTVDSEGENLKFDVPQVTVLRSSMFTRTELSSPINVLPDEELVVTTDSTGEVTNVIKRKKDD